MVFALVVIAGASAFALTLLGLALALIRRGLDLGPFVLAAITQIVVLVQAVAVVVRLAAGDRPESLALVLSYLLVAVLALPAGGYWALGERSRWSNVIMAVAGATEAAVVLRLWDLWPA